MMLTAPLMTETILMKLNKLTTEDLADVDNIDDVDYIDEDDNIDDGDIDDWLIYNSIDDIDKIEDNEYVDDKDVKGNIDDIDDISNVM